MKVVFFSHYYTPEGNAPASRTADHCRRWVSGDDAPEVTVITCVPNVPDGKVYDGFRNRIWPQREIIDGVEVLRVWTYIRPNQGRAGLILNYVSYLISALFGFVFFVRRPNVIVATSPQFFCGIAGILASWLKWRPVVLEVRDIWPASIVTVGAIRRGFVIRALEWLERWMYRNASHIVTVGPGYRDNILNKVDVADKISTVTNGVDVKQFIPLDGHEAFSHRFEIENRFVCSYIGTVGRAHGLDVIIHAAEQFKAAERRDVVFLIVGGGTRLDELRREVKQRGLDDLVKLTGRLDKHEVPNALAASDVCLVHLSKRDLFQHVIPSKIFETMAMKRAIIMGVRGLARDIVLAAESGVVMEPEDDKQLFEILCQLAGDEEALQQMGESGREFVLKYFNRDDLAADMLQVVRRTAQGESFRLEDRSWKKVDKAAEESLDLNPVTVNDR